MDTRAILKYGNGTFEIVLPGTHVNCAITNREIPLGDLLYWSVERQEPYVDAWASMEAVMREMPSGSTKISRLPG